MRSIVQDGRYASRQLRNSPGPRGPRLPCCRFGWADLCRCRPGDGGSFVDCSMVAGPARGCRSSYSGFEIGVMSND